MNNIITYKNSRMVGNIGESVAISEFVKFGIPVFMPFGQNTPVDLLVCVSGKFLKIQVKTTENAKDDVMKFDIARTNGFTKERNPYLKDEVDYFFLYCIENEYKGLIEFKQLKSLTQINIRCNKPKNNQIKGINFADEYLFKKKIAEII